MLFGGLHETINRSFDSLQTSLCLRRLDPLSLLYTCAWLLLELPRDDAYALLEQDKHGVCRSYFNL